MSSQDIKDNPPAELLIDAPTLADVKVEPKVEAPAEPPAVAPAAPKAADVEIELDLPEDSPFKQELKASQERALEKQRKEEERRKRKEEQEAAKKAKLKAQGIYEDEEPTEDDDDGENPSDIKPELKHIVLEVKALKNDYDRNMYLSNLVSQHEDAFQEQISKNVEKAAYALYKETKEKAEMNGRSVDEYAVMIGFESEDELKKDLKNQVLERARKEMKNYKTILDAEKNYILSKAKSLRRFESENKKKEEEATKKRLEVLSASANEFKKFMNNELKTKLISLGITPEEYVTSCRELAQGINYSKDVAIAKNVLESAMIGRWRETINKRAADTAKGLNSLGTPAPAAPSAQAKYEPPQEAVARMKAAQASIGMVI